MLWSDLHTVDSWERERGPEKGPSAPGAGSHMVSSNLEEKLIIRKYLVSGF